MRDVRFWHLADIPTAPVFVRFWTIADKVGFRPGTVCPLMTPSGHSVGLGSNSILLQVYGKLVAQPCHFAGGADREQNNPFCIRSDLGNGIVAGAIAGGQCRSRHCRQLHPRRDRHVFRAVCEDGADSGNSGTRAIYRSERTRVCGRTATRSIHWRCSTLMPGR
jgi:hypothetical protein